MTRCTLRRLLLLAHLGAMQAQVIDDQINALAGSLPAKLNSLKKALETAKSEVSITYEHKGGTPSIYGFSKGGRPYTPEENIKGAMSHLWLILTGALVMFMQSGFAMLEAGTCRRRFAQNILLKNLTDVVVGTMGWWIFGWSFAYSGPMDGDFKANNFAGSQEFLGVGFTTGYSDGQIEPTVSGSTSSNLNWFFQWAFCSAAATIVSGGVAERMKFPGYVLYSFLLSSFIYPIIVAWSWGYGFLAKVATVGYMDFAGSGIVHLAGGVGALVGAAVAGARPRRFKASRFKLEPALEEGEKDDFAPHSLPLVVLGTFILWFGWYGFNCGSTLAMETASTGALAAQVAMNTTIAAATAGLATLLIRFAVTKDLDVCQMCNGILAGLVSITAGCGNLETGAAFTVGLIGSLIYCGAAALLKFVKIDDPLDAFPIHGACGCWGVLAAALFDWGKGFDYVHGWGGFDCTAGDSGCLRGVGGSQFAANLCEVVVIAVWVGGLSAIIFVPLHILGVLIADNDSIERGFDADKHSPNKAYDMPSGREGAIIQEVSSPDTGAGAGASEGPRSAGYEGGV